MTVYARCLGSGTPCGVPMDQQATDSRECQEPNRSRS